MLLLHFQLSIHVTTTSLVAQTRQTQVVRPQRSQGMVQTPRTVMQIRVRNITPAAPYNLTALQAVFAKTGAKRGVFEVSQDPIIAPTDAYDSAYNATFPEDQFVRIQDNFMTFQTVSGATLTVPLEPKAMQDEMGEAYDIKYGECLRC